MKKWTKSVLVTVLSAVFLLGCMGTAWAGTNDRDTNSNFAKNANTQEDGISEFYLIKDYDSVHATATAPNSVSPAEIFTYTITPYGVWNAGYTTANPTQAINTSNMPMLQKPTGTTANVSYDDTTTARTLVVSQTVAAGAAQKEDADNNANDDKAKIVLPTYETVGDYWYQVQETIGANRKRTTGVIYGTNSSAENTTTESNEIANFSHTGTYYIHVQVTQATTSSNGALVKNVTLHTNAPTSNWTNAEYATHKDNLYGGGNKVNAIENRYYAGQLKVTKVVSGNAGDTTQYFQVRVTFIKPSGTVVNSDISVADAFMLSGTTYSVTPLTIKGQYYDSTAGANEIKWDKGANDDTEAKAVVEFFVTNGTTVSFTNIPLGINYTVEEELIPDSGYSNTFNLTRGTDELTTKFNGSNLTNDSVTDSESHFYDNYDDTATPATNVGAQGSISGPNADTVTITNSKAMTIDIGVITENAPYIAMLAVAGAALFLLFLRKKNPSEV